MVSYIVNGHSDATEDMFTVPSRVTIIFSADSNESCYSPNNEEDVNFIIHSMSEGGYDTFTGGSSVPNYTISFDEMPFQGIAKINAPSNYVFSENKDEKTLEHICNYLQKTNRENITIFCIICRGSESEFNYDFGDFSNMDMADINMDDINDLGGASVFPKGGNKRRTTKRQQKKTETETETETEKENYKKTTK